MSLQDFLRVMNYLSVAERRRPDAQRVTPSLDLARLQRLEKDGRLLPDLNYAGKVRTEAFWEAVDEALANNQLLIAQAMALKADWKMVIEDALMQRLTNVHLVLSDGAQPMVKEMLMYVPTTDQPGAPGIKTHLFRWSNRHMNFVA